MTKKKHSLAGSISCGASLPSRPSRIMGPKGRKRAPKAEEGPKSLLDCWDAVRASEKRRRTSSDTCVTLWTFSKALQQLGLECVRCGRQGIERALDEVAPWRPS